MSFGDCTLAGLLFLWYLFFFKHFLQLSNFAESLFFSALPVNYFQLEDLDVGLVLKHFV